MSTSSYIDFKTLSGFNLEVVLQAITVVLRVAGKHDGRVFGGFVRDVIVPRIYEPNKHVSFKDVDIWFKSQDRVNFFIKELESKPGMKLKETSPIAVDSHLYKFLRKQYFLYEYDTCVAWMDCIISDTIPVDDFNVNKLTYQYQENGPFKTESFGDESAEALIASIHAKQAVILPSYVNKLAGNEDMLRNIHLRRLERIFLDKGWKISYNALFPDHVSITWIRHNLRVTPALELPPKSQEQLNILPKVPQLVAAFAAAVPPVIPGQVMTQQTAPETSYEKAVRIQNTQPSKSVSTQSAQSKPPEAILINPITLFDVCYQTVGVVFDRLHNATQLNETSLNEAENLLNSSLESIRQSFVQLRRTKT